MRHHSFWGGRAPDAALLSESTRGGPEPGQNGTSDDQNQAAATEKHVRGRSAWPRSLLCASLLLTALFRETPDHVAAALVLFVFVAAAAGVA